MKAERRLPKSPKTTPWKTTMTMEKQPFEDVFPIKTVWVWYWLEQQKCSGHPIFGTHHKFSGFFSVKWVECMKPPIRLSGMSLTHTPCTSQSSMGLNFIICALRRSTNAHVGVACIYKKDYIYVYITPFHGKKKEKLQRNERKLEDV